VYRTNDKVSIILYTHEAGWHETLTWQSHHPPGDVSHGTIDT